MQITLSAPLPGDPIRRRPGAVPPPPPQNGAAIPAGLLVNQELLHLGDSRAVGLSGLRYHLAGPAQKLRVVNDSQALGLGGYSIAKLNGINGTDYVGQTLQRSEGVIVVLAGYNDLGGADLPGMQADMMALLKRLNAVKVAVTGESGSFARDTTGAYADWGDACSDGAGGVGVVTHADGAGHVWLSEFSGLANGDVITCANSGYQATLAEDPPAHSGRLVAVYSELPASYYAGAAGGGPGAAHQGFHDWLESEPYDGMDLSFFRTINAMDGMTGAPNPPDYPLPFETGYSDDAIHPSPEGAQAGAMAAGAELDDILANYDQVFPNDQTPPAGVVDLSTGVPFTGAGPLPTGWTTSGAPLATPSLIGPDGDPDRILELTLDTQDSGLATGYWAYREHQSNYTTPYDCWMRFGVEFRLTNMDEDGPPVGVGQFFALGIDTITPDGASRAHRIRRNAFIPGWTRLMTTDKFCAGGETGLVRMALSVLHDRYIPVNFRAQFRRPRVWMIPA